MRQLTPHRRGVALSLCLVAIALASRSGTAADDGWVDLFNGKNLDNWTRHGGVASYTIEDGAIVGTTAPDTPNTFLATKKTYGDFVLELEYRVDPTLNSGVQIRSQVRKQERNGQPFRRVYGYQVEIDPSDRAWSGGIYDEGRRGWLDDLKDNQPAREAFKQNDWNHYRIECFGDSIKTWINGVPAADLIDGKTLEGFIALQVHSYKGEKPAQVRWRNLRIREARPIFNGKSTDGWEVQGGGEWKVENGVLIGTNTKDKPVHGHLFFERPVKDFSARVTYRAVAGNSGFYFRVDKRGGNVGVAGFQAEIDASKDAGGLYETRGRAWVVQPSPEKVKECFKPGEWNEMIVTALGTRVVVYVNGVKTAELPDDEKGRREGYLALQLHGSQDVDVRFRRIELLEKKPSP